MFCYDKGYKTACTWAEMLKVPENYEQKNLDDGVVVFTDKATGAPLVRERVVSEQCKRKPWLCTPEERTPGPYVVAGTFDTDAWYKSTATNLAETFGAFVKGAGGALAGMGAGWVTALGVLADNVAADHQADLAEKKSRRCATSSSSSRASSASSCPLLAPCARQAAPGSRRRASLSRARAPRRPGLRSTRATHLFCAGSASAH